MVWPERWEGGGRVNPPQDVKRLEGVLVGGQSSTRPEAMLASADKYVHIYTYMYTHVYMAVSRLF